jgi:hypothetical protein
MLISFSCAVMVSALAQTAKHPAGTRQAPADAETRQQLAAYLAEFQGHPADVTLRNEIVALAKTLNPAPAIPELARTNFSHATAQLNAAKSAGDFKAAASQFEQVAVQAPWYADADYYAASADAKAGDFDSARNNLALYLAAVRPGVDARNAEELSRDLDRQQTALHFDQDLQQFRAKPTDAARVEIIKLVQAMKTPPEIPEEARGHFVMAVVLGNTAEGDPAEEQRAVEEYKAALLAAPWWGEAYKKLAAAQTAANLYDDAVATLNFYLLTDPADARNAQDEIYRLKALWQKSADEQAKKQAGEQQRKLLLEKKEQQRAAVEGGKYTVQGKWYQASASNELFAGGESNPECDYDVKQSGGRWSITNSCSRSTRTIEEIEVQGTQLSFRIKVHDPSFPFAEVIVMLTLSDDGQTMEGHGTPYDRNYARAVDRPTRWIRRQ